MDENKTNEQALQEAKTNELGTLATVEEVPKKKKKTNLITPIISIVLGGLAWISIVFSQQLENFSNLIKILTGNQQASQIESELGKIEGNDSLMGIIENYGFVILLLIVLVIFTIIGIVGICKLITRICRRTKNKFTKD